MFSKFKTTKKIILCAVVAALVFPVAFSPQEASAVTDKIRLAAAETAVLAAEASLAEAEGGVAYSLGVREAAKVTASKASLAVGVPTSNSQDAISLLEAEYQAALFARDTLLVGLEFAQAELALAQGEKESFWDGVAWGVAKIALNRMTLSIVQWIRTGYDGQPSFLTNTADFLRDIGNQATGVFINELGLNDVLCGPWQFSVKLALQVQAPYLIKAQCTLLDAEANFQRMSENFAVAGWQGFFDITVNQVNNPYNAFLSAQSELAVRIGEREASQTNALLMGSGFFGVTKKGECLQETTNLGGTVCVRRAPDQTVTPGAFIAETTIFSSLSPMRQMEIADELDEALSVIAGEVILQALSPNRGLSNIDTVTLEQANEAFAKRNADRLGGSGGAVDTAVNDVTQAKNIKNASLLLIAGPIDAAYTALIGVEDVSALPPEGTLGGGQISAVLLNGSCMSRLPGTTAEISGHIATLKTINATEVAIIADISEAGTLIQTLEGYRAELQGPPTPERVEEITRALNTLNPRLTENAAASEKATLESQQTAVETALSACETAAAATPVAL